MVATLYQVRSAYNYADGPGFSDCGLLVVDDDDNRYTLQMVHYVGFGDGAEAGVEFRPRELTRDLAYEMVRKGERDHAHNVELYGESGSYTDGTYPNEVVRLDYRVNPFARGVTRGYAKPLFERDTRKVIEDLLDAERDAGNNGRFMRAIQVLQTSLGIPYLEQYHPDPAVRTA